MTPTLLAAVLSRHSDIGSRVPELRTLWLNGEVVTTDLARRAMEALPNVRLLNVYSACETHEIACGDIETSKYFFRYNTYAYNMGAICLFSDSLPGAVLQCRRQEQLHHT